MSGHSKWASIKHKKGALDAKRGQLFTKLIKEISIAARMGGGDIEGNPRLRTTVLKARAANMPKDNIDRAIKKGTGELEGTTYEELFYEAYAPGGGAMLIEVLTDNKNRAAAEIRNIVTRSGANLGTAGSVVYLFKRKGVLTYDGEKYTEDQILEALSTRVRTMSSMRRAPSLSIPIRHLSRMYERDERQGLETLGAEISMVPTPTSVSMSRPPRRSRSSSTSSRRMKTSRTCTTISKCPNSKKSDPKMPVRSSIVAMGIDPGIAAVGYGLVSAVEGKLNLIAHGCIQTESSEPMGKRLAYIFHEIEKLLRQYAPDVGGIEELYFFRNVSSALPVAEAGA
jgi:YebC/PmpR family DNA-binding regulatory protein